MTQADLDAAAAQFHAEGFVQLQYVLQPDEVAHFRSDVVAAHSEPCPTGNPTPFHRHQMFLRGPHFVSLLDREPVIDVVERLLGKDCHVIANNTVFTRPASGIDRWHVDETVLFPIPDGVSLDGRIDMPCFIVTAMYYLDDVDRGLGPTQIVPGSHRSGRQPPPQDQLLWEGRGPVTILASAGDCLLLNGQTWHRGATNCTTDRIRAVQQVTYGRRFIAQRFYPFVNHRIPESLLAGASARQRRLLGEHPHGPYG